MKRQSILNQTKLMKCGVKCTVVEDNGYDDIIVQFEDEDKTIKKSNRGSFLNGTICNPSLKRKTSIKGKSNIMANGMKCTVIEDNGYEDITVQFEDGTVKYNCTRHNFNRGKITNPSLRRGYTCAKRYSIKGKSNIMTNGMKCTVIEDNGRNDIVVQFEDGYTVKSNRYDFNRGKVVNANIVKGSVLGQTAEMKCGMKCTVIEDRNSKDISVKFEDGTEVKHIRREYFKVRTIANPSLGKNYTRLLNASIKGQSKIMKTGMKCTVIDDFGKDNITVQFEDGTKKENCSRDSYFKGSIIHPHLGRGYAYSKKNSILGQTKLMRCGMKCTVIEDNSADDITVQFEDGTIVKHRLRHSFQHRSILNPKLLNISSLPQRLIFYFITQYFSDAVQDFRPNWLKNDETNFNMEIDIWIPSKKVGIEYDGVVWHKEKNSRSEKKFDLIKNAKEIEMLITVLERGAILHTSPKHLNIQLETTSSNRETDKFLFEMERVINEILEYLGVSEHIHIDDDVLEKIYSSDVVMVYSHNLIKGENDLETLRPDLAEEWDFDKNKFLPSDITCGSGRTVWWKCKDCGYSWPTRIQQRTNGRNSNCPNCKERSNAKRRVKNVETNEVYESIADASRKTNISSMCISMCCNGKRNTAGGYHWKFENENIKL